MRSRVQRMTDAQLRNISDPPPVSGYYVQRAHPRWGVIGAVTNAKRGGRWAVHVYDGWDVKLADRSYSTKHEAIDALRELASKH